SALVLVHDFLAARTTLLPYTTLFRSHTGRFAAQYRTARMLLAQPGQDLRVTFAEAVEIVPERGKNDDVSVFQSAIDRDHHVAEGDRKSTRLNSSHVKISDAVFCWKKK